jgi:hypothetical protein
MLITLHHRHIERTCRVPDGSTLSLDQVIVTATNFQYSKQTGGRFFEIIGPRIPKPILARLHFSGGQFGFGSNGETNLIAITTLHPHNVDAKPTMSRLRIFDDQNNLYDGRWGAMTLETPDETVNGWQIQAFPRRRPEINLQFLTELADGTSTNAATYRIRNPLFASYPQWTPEPLPNTKGDSNLMATLTEFISGNPMPNGLRKVDPSLEARGTGLHVAFSENGTNTHDWRVQALTVSDATGNHWRPYLEQQSNRSKDGTSQFFEALWPGEQAWKLEIEAVRNANFKPDEIYETTITMPAPGAIASLTDHWQHDGTELTLDGIASPKTDHPGNFKWIAKWWGNDSTSVYSLALHLSPASKAGRWLILVHALDQDEKPVEIVGHRNPGSDRQAIFLKPHHPVTHLKLAFTLQTSRTFQFLARPNFVETEPNSTNIRN